MSAFPLAFLLLFHFLPKAEPSPFLLDKIYSLPGQPLVGFPQYSGYVHVGEHDQKALFYYFAEAQVDPPSKPLVLWLNGGIWVLHFHRNRLIDSSPFGFSFFCELVFVVVLCRSWMFFSGSWGIF